MEIYRIVITGGPCAGKSSALVHLKNELAKLGWTVLVMAETATELISSGIAPWTCRTPTEYQKYQIELQCAKENVFLSAAKNMPADKILIVCDRGLMDNLAYMAKEDFESILYQMGKTTEEIRQSYDAVFHLITAADGAECFYTTANNTARTESVAEALELDKRSAAAWAGHKYYRTIDNSTDFAGKLLRLTKAVEEFIKKQE